MIKFVLTLALFLGGQFSQYERQYLCSLVDNHVVIPAGKAGDRYNNGYKEERYDFVLDSFIEEFERDINSRGGSFHIMRDWGDGAVNAWAWRIGKEYWMEVPGGMARYGIINEEAFLSTLCHELGHLLGGAPHGNEISYEGQADYYAPMKCMERVLDRLGVIEKVPPADLDCEGQYCGNRFDGIKSLTKYYAQIAKTPEPSLRTPSGRVVSRTLQKHPDAQCRFDTMVAALKCPDRSDFDYEDPGVGACYAQGSARPRCWYSPSKAP